MAWSEQIGSSIILPSDVDPDNPDRNYLLIGEELPVEVASSVSAGIVFYNVTADAGESAVTYWVFGIDTSGVLRVIAMWRQWVGTDGFGNDIYDYQTINIFSLNPGTGIDDPPYVQILTSPNQRLGAWYEEPDLGSVATTLQAKVARLRITTTSDLTLTSGLHGFEVSNPAETLKLVADNNEIGSKTLTAGVWGWTPLFIYEPQTTSPQGTDAGSLTRKDYVDGLAVNGNESVTITAINTVMTKAVSFGKTFPTPPIVTLTVVSTTPQQITGLGVSAVTTTGFNLHVVRTTTTTTGINWLATAV